MPHRRTKDEKQDDAVKLAPSILSADFARLGEQEAAAERAGADRIHVDIMDGHFVPNISMGAPIVASLRRVTRFKATGKRVGVAINPATPAVVLEEILQDVGQVLVMTVDPGFGHQDFLHSTLHKIRRVRQMIAQINPECELEVDGGIASDTAPLAVAAGANVLVAGTAIFSESESVAAAMNRLRASIARQQQSHAA